MWFCWSTAHILQCALKWFTKMYKTAGISVRSSKTEAMALNWKQRNEKKKKKRNTLSHEFGFQAFVFKHLGHLLMIYVSMECEIMKQIWVFVCSNEGVAQVCCDKKIRIELKGKTLSLPFFKVPTLKDINR